MPFTFKLSQRLARMRSALRLFETASSADSWRGTPVVVAVQPGSVAPQSLDHFQFPVARGRSAPAASRTL